MEPVSVWTRLFNFIADILFVRFVLLRLAVYPILRQAVPSLVTYSHDSLVWLSYLINAVVIFIYYFVAELTTGMTVGKLLTQTIVVTEYGEQPSTRNILIRTLWRLVPFEPFSWGRNAGLARYANGHYCCQQKQVAGKPGAWGRAGIRDSGIGPNGRKQKCPRFPRPCHPVPWLAIAVNLRNKDFIGDLKSRFFTFLRFDQ